MSKSGRDVRPSRSMPATAPDRCVSNANPAAVPMYRGATRVGGC
ncbi:hypothetical protein C7S13_3885 [Burkholderia cepacia]|nr:hypothetical protein [Burkholderia cepacia]